MLTDERLENRDNLFLLAARESRRLIEELAHAARRRKHAFGFVFSEQLLDGNAQCRSHGNQQIRARQISRALPIPDIGMILIQLPGQLSNREPGGLAQLFEVMTAGCHEGIVRRLEKKCLHNG